MTRQAAESDFVDRLLAATPTTDLGCAARDILQRQAGLSVGVGETIARQLVSRLNDAAALADAMQTLEKHDNASSRFVQARVLAYRGESARAIDGFQAALQAASVPDADVLLHRARLLARENRFPEAIAELRLALQLFPPYAFFVKSEKLLGRIVASGHWQPRRTAKLAILSSSTTSLLAPVLRAAGFRCGLKLDIYEGVYGNYRQEILDPQSGLYRFQPDLAVILLEPPRSRPAARGRRRAGKGVRRGAARIVDGCLLERNPCHLVQIGIDSPPIGAWGSLEDTLPEGRRKLIAASNLALAADLPQGVSFVDANAIAAEIGHEYWSASEWHAAKQYPGVGRAAAAGRRHLCSLRRRAGLDRQGSGGRFGQHALGRRHRRRPARRDSRRPVVRRGRRLPRVAAVSQGTATAGRAAGRLLEEQSGRRGIALPPSRRDALEARRFRGLRGQLGRQTDEPRNASPRISRWAWTASCFSTTIRWSAR